MWNNRKPYCRGRNKRKEHSVKLNVYEKMSVGVQRRDRYTVYYRWMVWGEKNPSTDLKRAIEKGG